MPFDIDWQSIDDVLLDMDGTLLDLHYDATFWLKNLQSIVAGITGDSEINIRDRFQKELKKHEGTLVWYCTRLLGRIFWYRPHWGEETARAPDPF